MADDATGSVKENDPLIVGKQHELIRDVEASDWVDRVIEKSEASKWVSEVLKDVDQRKVDGLKKEMFEMVYQCLGDEMLPEDLVRAVAVKTEKFAWWAVCLLNCCTCCLFGMFRPRDDETVLVMTKKERVLMYKVERLNFFGNFGEVFIRFVKFVIAIVCFYGLQQVILQALGSEVFARNFGNVQEFATAVEKQLQEKRWLQIIVFIAVALGMIFWLWTKCPHDYGTRTRQSHAANKVCCGQYSLSGGNWRRKATFRLFFGRYPEQSSMDHSMQLRGTPVAGPIPRESLAVGGNALNPFSNRSKSGLIVVGIILLNVLTFLDAGLTYIVTPMEGLKEIERMKDFCLLKHTVSSNTCTPGKCSEWAENQLISNAFCHYVHFYSDPNADQDIVSCNQYGHPPPCCGGCRVGGLRAQASNTMETFKLMVGLLTDIGTLVFALAAASQIMTVAADKGNISFKWGKRPHPQSHVADFLLTQPLANQFMNTVFDSAFNDPGFKPNTNARGGPKLRRQRRYDQISGDDGANFRDVTNFHLLPEYKQWEEFFNGVGSNPKMLMVDKGEDKWVPKINVPKRILGIHEDEQVLAAWSEKPQITFLMLSPVILSAVVIWLLLLCLERDSSLKWLMFLGESPFGKIMADTIISGGLLLLSLLVLYVIFFVAQKHAVIMTDKRMFYVRYRDKCLFLCMYTVQMRVDVFRHDHDITYGSMSTNPPSMYMRCSGVPWTPGTVIIQPGIYGVLQLARQRGNVLNVYQVVSQLVQAQEPIIDERMVRKAGVSWDIVSQYVRDNMEARLADVWTIVHRQPDDLQDMMPDMFLAHANEKPVFFWSFKEFGTLTTPTSTNTDVVITTNRVYKYNRANFKSYDCRTALCFGACYCTACKRIFNGPKYLQRSSSFLMMPSMLSFATEVTVSPPVWYDPHRTPVKFPCWETCCTWLTKCMTCSICGAEGSGVTCDTSTCSCIPRRGGARAQLWMMWRHKFNALQPDLMCKIRPFWLKDKAFIADVWERLGCGSNQLEFEDSMGKGDDMDWQKVDMLRKIMGIVQDAAGEA